MRQHADSAGFTLIEMLVAITLMALLLLPLMRSFSSGLFVRSRTDVLTEATLIAEAELETFAAKSTFSGETSFDRFEGRYSVHTSVGRYVAGSFDAELPVRPYEIQVTVSWPDGSQTRSVDLRMLRLGPSAPGDLPLP